MASSTPVRTVLITGCGPNSIGDALAREFLNRNFRVHATARDAKKLQHLHDLGATTHSLDLTSTSSIRALSKEITHLDMLLNNAGQVTNQPLLDLTDAQFRREFEVNLFGTKELVISLMPLLIAAKGTIVNHTSQAAYNVPVYCSAYAASKAALAALTTSMRIEFAPLDVKVVELVTGVVKSNIVVTQLPKTVLQDPESLYTPISKEFSETIAGGGALERAMDGDTYARQVVAKLTANPKNPPVWIWAGTYAWLTYFMWFIGVFWKGYSEGLMLRLTKLGELKKRRESENQAKQK